MAAVRAHIEKACEFRVSTKILKAKVKTSVIFLLPNAGMAISHPLVAQLPISGAKS